MATLPKTNLETESTDEDPVLMERVAHNDGPALENLHRRYRRILRSVIMQVLHDDAEAEDVLQDVFLQVWNRPRTYSASRGKLVNWLATLARRRAIDHLRQRSAYRRATDRYEVLCNHPDKTRSETHPVEHAAQQDDLRKFMQNHLRRLPLEQQEALRLSFFEGRTQREISRITETPLGTVKTRIELGLRKLGQMVGKARAQFG